MAISTAIGLALTVQKNLGFVSVFVDGISRRIVNEKNKRRSFTIHASRSECQVPVRQKDYGFSVSVSKPKTVGLGFYMIVLNKFRTGSQELTAVERPSIHATPPPLKQ